MKTAVTRLTPLAIALLAGLVGPALPVASATPLESPESRTVDSHYYGPDVSAFTLPAKTPWVTHLAGGDFLTPGADDAGGVPVPDFLGGTKLQYPVGVFNAVTGDLRSLGELDVLPIEVGDKRVGH